ncbi:hypothetical protein EMIHUDRAFT_459742, partial [Emiliania huxleyi CCMP1516]|uniref:Uncharacterized protein n=2 Tax=Emiliania huxleyi TaxID=2903 RepID=A0A0D3IKB9_EMIH1
MRAASGTRSIRASPLARSRRRAHRCASLRRGWPTAAARSSRNFSARRPARSEIESWPCTGTSRRRREARRTSAWGRSAAIPPTPYRRLRPEASERRGRRPLASPPALAHLSVGAAPHHRRLRARGAATGGIGGAFRLGRRAGAPRVGAHRVARVAARAGSAARGGRRAPLARLLVAAGVDVRAARGGAAARDARRPRLRRHARAPLCRGDCGGDAAGRVRPDGRAAAPHPVRPARARLRPPRASPLRPRPSPGRRRRRRAAAARAAAAQAARRGRLQRRRRARLPRLLRRGAGVGGGGGAARRGRRRRLGPASEPRRLPHARGGGQRERAVAAGQLGLAPARGQVGRACWRFYSLRAFRKERQREIVAQESREISLFKSSDCQC